MNYFHCYFCNYELIGMISENSEDVSHLLSTHCHIATYFFCSNHNCESIHIEELDIDGNILYIGPLQNEKRL